MVYYLSVSPYICDVLRIRDMPTYRIYVFDERQKIIFTLFFMRINRFLHYSTKENKPFLQYYLYSINVKTILECIFFLSLLLTVMILKQRHAHTQSIWF